MRIFVPAALLFTVACGNTMEVGPHKVPCMGESSQLCMIVDDEYFYDEIVGFDFEWGKDATIRARIQRIAQPMADGSSRAVTLTELVSSEDSAEMGFSWTVRFADVDFGHNVAVDVANRQLLDGTPFECEEEVCATAQQLSDDRAEATLEFEYGSPLQLTAAN